MEALDCGCSRRDGGAHSAIQWLEKKCRQTQRNIGKIEIRYESKRLRNQFPKSPYDFAKKLFTEARNGKLACTKEQFVDHIKQTYSDPKRDDELPHMEGLKHPTKPGIQFKLSDITNKEVDQFVPKARAKSAPGSDGVSYKVYKLLRSATLQVVYPTERALVERQPGWRQTAFRKEANSEQTGQFRQISLLNVDGKIYMGILPKRTVDFLQNNGYIGASVQKAGISGIPGCIEHVSTIWEAIQEAKTSKTI